MPYCVIRSIFRWLNICISSTHDLYLLNLTVNISLELEGIDDDPFYEKFYPTLPKYGKDQKIYVK